MIALKYKSNTLSPPSTSALSSKLVNHLRTYLASRNKEEKSSWIFENIFHSFNTTKHLGFFNLHHERETNTSGRIYTFSPSFGGALPGAKKYPYSFSTLTSLGIITGRN